MTSPASGIYRIRNILNDRVYIGSAVNLARRWGLHKHQLRQNKHHSLKLQRAWNKYGEDRFVFEIVELVDDRGMLVEREQNWLDSTSACACGYNTVPVAGSSLGHKYSKESRDKLRASRLGHVRSLESRIKQSEAMRGKPKSPEHRASMAAANKARGDRATAARLKRDAEKRENRLRLLSIGPLPNKVCSHCGKMFYAPNCRLGKYCSQSCYHSAKITDSFTRTCRKCGNKFTFHREKGHRYCPPCAIRSVLK